MFFFVSVLFWFSASTYVTSVMRSTGEYPDLEKGGLKYSVLYMVGETEYEYEICHSPVAESRSYVLRSSDSRMR